MNCEECKRQIGANGTRHGHANLSLPGDSIPPGFQVQRFQTLYFCRVCRSVLSRGRNTGWRQAAAIPLPIGIVPADVAGVPVRDQAH
ncbi:MAG: hypothetical protein K0Q76_4217 [Panacagrimonas sp.]|nr:hypothetical protein [Panacagrimonas sp.]